MSNDLTRRGFLNRASIYGCGISLTLAGGLPLARAAAEKSTAPLSLSPAQWCAAEAMTARLIPSGDTPGALEANCVNFIDKALANEEKAALYMVRQCLDALDQHCEANNGSVFCHLSPEQQDGVLVNLENSDIRDWPEDAVPQSAFFGLVRALTIMGFLAEPKYGGNQGFAGWQLSGYPGPRHHRGGYTDAQMMGEETIKPVWETG